jgi:hypothetical protein
MTPLAKSRSQRSQRFSLMGKRSQAAHAQRRLESIDAEDHLSSYLAGRK